ncbi:general transcription factor IIF subunit 1-like isoform X4 [Branchiostoma floridae]|uniref:Transcription initiation factor IIF subunit alpha n=1 Tax=Branchiostoma floridae TaxID=7739 RepID=A0A9J7NAX0_BRAFL|nr:general transcription factor IIF subunit 1-like isoform X4 [Branchiostoma floridae]
MSAQPSGSGSLQGGLQGPEEFTVKIQKNPQKKYNVMRFAANSAVDMSAWKEANMERETSTMDIYKDESMPEYGEGSEYGRKWREEARQKKYGINKTKLKLEDQPWLLKVGGKGGKRFVGRKEGGINEASSYFVFRQTGNKTFEACPVESWYNFTPQIKYRYLNEEEAEAEFEKRHKVLNYFNIMMKKRLENKDEAETEGETEKNVSARDDLRVREGDDSDSDLGGFSDDSDNEAEGKKEKAKTAKKKKDTKVQKKKKKKQKGSDDEALEDSDEGDYDGREVDYMSDEDESASEEEVDKSKADGTDLKGVDQEMEMSSSEEEEEGEGEKEGEAAEGEKTAEDKPDKKESDSSSSEDSDVDLESSALFMQSKKGKTAFGKASSKGNSKSGSSSSSRASTPAPDGGIGSTLAAAAKKLEQQKGTKRAGEGDSPLPKKARHSRSHDGSGSGTPTSELGLTEESVRRYLMRKPMTAKDLLKKFPTGKTGLNRDQTVAKVTEILKKLNPEKKTINGKIHLWLKS